MTEDLQVIDVVDPDMEVSYDRLGDAEKCRRAMVYEGKDLRTVCRELGVKRADVKRWATEGKWGFERNIVESGKSEAIEAAMERFAMSYEMPLGNGYYGLQEDALDRLRELMSTASSASEVGLILEVANKGLGLGERVLDRCNPDRAQRLKQNENVTVVGGGERQVSVNILSALVNKSEGKDG